MESPCRGCSTLRFAQTSAQLAIRHGDNMSYFGDCLGDRSLKSRSLNLSLSQSLNISLSRHPNLFKSQYFSLDLYL